MVTIFLQPFLPHSIGGGFMIGRMVSAGLKNVAPRPMLITVTVAAIVLMAISMLTENLWLMAAVGLFHSVMWSCIFTLAVDGLKEYTSKASGVFMMGVFGGAVFPVLRGIACRLYRFMAVHLARSSHLRVRHPLVRTCGL